MDSGVLPYAYLNGFEWRIWIRYMLFSGKRQKLAEPVVMENVTLIKQNTSLYRLLKKKI